MAKIKRENRGALRNFWKVVFGNFGNQFASVTLGLAKTFQTCTPVFGLEY